MDSRVLHYFLTVAQLGNITKAAEALHITQPTLSRQIRALEEELHTPLLVRRHRDVALTENGILFQQRAAEILALVGKAENDLSRQDSQLAGILHIGMVESSVADTLADVLADFHNRHPLVRYRLYNANADDIKEKLDWGHLDFGIVLEPAETAKYDCLRIPVMETWGVVVREEDPLAGRRTLRCEEVAGSPLILPSRDIVIDEIVKWLTVPRAQLNIPLTQNLLTNVLPLVRRGLGRVMCIEGAFLSRPASGLRFIPFEPARTSAHVLVWKKNKTLSRVATTFLEALAAHLS